MTQLRDRLTNAVKAAAARNGILLARYVGLRRRERLALVQRVAGQRTLLLSPGEACQLLACLETTDRVAGDVAELGVAYGASAKLLSICLPAGKHLHLFDTFEGLPEATAADGVRFHAGEFSSNLEDVRRYVGTERVHYYPGLFPATTGPLNDRLFSFVHLDADLYESTLAAFDFFYERLSPGGIILCHDYPSASGVVQALADFFRDKPEPVVELTGYQAMVVKVGGRRPLTQATGVPEG
jgi:predicted O-methyltransferase YrrM